MERLIFVSHRTGSPQIFAEIRATGELVQLTDRPDLAEWSLHPARNGTFVVFIAGTSAWRLDLPSLEEHELVRFDTSSMREKGMVGAAMGTTTLSHDDRWWAVPVKVGELSRFYVIDTGNGACDIILERDTIGHPQFCPDDSSLLFYAGPMTDRLWLINRDGTNDRRLLERSNPLQWVTHESWISGRRELAFVDWPHGMKAVHVDTGQTRTITEFPAWHAYPNDTGQTFVCDTNFPDIGLHVFPSLGSANDVRFLCKSEATSIGDHWAKPFPYNNGPVKVYAPQHTHPHPRFSPDGKFIVFTSDRTGHAQLYEAEFPTTFNIT